MTKTVDADPETAALAVPRPGSAIWIPWFGWLIEAGLLIDLVHRGNMTDLLNYAPWLLLVGWAIWVLLWAPRLLVYRDRVEVIEPLRCFRLPFHRITDVRLGVALRIDYTDASGRARRLRPWNAPARRDLKGEQPAQSLRDAWQAAPGRGDEQAQVRWLTGRAALLLALAAASALTLLV